MPRLLLATDAWRPQVNGVVRTIENTLTQLSAQGYEYEVIHPELFNNFPAPLYPEIKLAFPRQKTVARKIRDFQPDHIHIATEGPIGQRVRKFCVKNNYSFSTSFHTLFPDYLKALAGVPPSITWRFFRWFHSAAKSTMVPTHFIKDLLSARGFTNLNVWSRGIDREIFYPHEPVLSRKGGKPILLYVGRVSREKNIEEFLRLETESDKYVVGDGPIRAQLESKYPQATFVGYKKGHDLAAHFSSADVFVFPSKTDTFGNVVLEALACGVPVAAFPLAGALELVSQDTRLGAVDESLQIAVDAALKSGESSFCHEFSTRFTWQNAANQFISGLVPV